MSRTRTRSYTRRMSSCHSPPCTHGTLRAARCALCARCVRVCAPVQVPSQQPAAARYVSRLGAHGHPRSSKRGQEQKVSEAERLRETRRVDEAALHALAGSETLQVSRDGFSAWTTRSTCATFYYLLSALSLSTVSLPSLALPGPPSLSSLYLLSRVWQGHPRGSARITRHRSRRVHLRFPRARERARHGRRRLRRKSRAMWPQSKRRLGPSLVTTAH